MQHVSEEFNIRGLNVENVTEENDPFPPTFRDFQSFPRRHGWALEADYRLVLYHPPDSDPGISQSIDLHNIIDHQARFLQVWLFFGLIFTVVRNERGQLLTYNQLVTRERTQVTTKELNKALKSWQEWECSNVDQLRLVRIEQVLDIARRTVRQNCSDDGSNSSQLQPQDKLYVSPRIKLSLMILGETLSAVKAKILEQTGCQLRAWHRNDGQGWGQPGFVWSSMKMRKWCPRIVHLWESQLVTNATLLLSYYMAYHGTDAEERFMGKDHFSGEKPCNKHRCIITPEATDGNGNRSYQPSHAVSCSGNCGIREGPNMVQVRQILQDDKIPLVRFKYGPQNHESTELEVLELPQGSTAMSYATISHVWSDGFGNPLDNTIYVCQLLFIRRQLSKLPENESVDAWRRPFWMDTLLIPVRDEDKNLRKTAINQITELFQKSSYSIVLDGGLCKVDPGDENRPAHAAMRILASSWMRRLWTLQEAFLSKRIYFSFLEGGKNLLEYENLSKRLNERSDEITTTVLLNLVHNTLQHHIMGHEQSTRDSYLYRTDLKSKLPKKQAAVLMANSWRAVRMRTTSNPFHETLALATLLNLDYQNTRISTAGIEFETRETRQEKDYHREQDSLMKEFWGKFNSLWPGSIHPGLIFLPGKRIDQRGFGWAPRTWLTAHAVDPPDPLSILYSTAELDTSDKMRGLRVQYPGFLLWTHNRNHILATDNHANPKFWFPSDPSFLDWYVVEPADMPGEEITSRSFIPGIQSSENSLAIILSRPRPANTPAEIGLLVQIYEKQSDESRAENNTTGDINRDFSSLDNDTIFCCEIIHRVKVARETGGDFYAANRGRVFRDFKESEYPFEPQARFDPPEVMVDTDADGQICLAEALPSSQVWYVDGFFRGGNPQQTTSKVASPPSVETTQRLLFPNLGSSMRAGGRRSGVSPPATGGTGSQAPRRETIGAVIVQADTPPEGVTGRHSFTRVGTDVGRRIRRGWTGLRRIRRD